MILRSVALSMLKRDRDKKDQVHEKTKLTNQTWPTKDQKAKSLLAASNRLRVFLLMRPVQSLQSKY